MRYRLAGQLTSSTGLPNIVSTCEISANDDRNLVGPNIWHVDALQVSPFVLYMRPVDLPARRVDAGHDESILDLMALAVSRMEHFLRATRSVIACPITVTQGKFSWLQIQFQGICHIPLYENRLDFAPRL